MDQSEYLQMFLKEMDLPFQAFDDHLELYFNEKNPFLVTISCNEDDRVRLSTCLADNVPSERKPAVKKTCDEFLRTTGFFCDFDGETVCLYNDVEPRPDQSLGTSFLELLLDLKNAINICLPHLIFALESNVIDRVFLKFLMATQHISEDDAISQLTICEDQSELYQAKIRQRFMREIAALPVLDVTDVPKETPPKDSGKKRAPRATLRLIGAVLIFVFFIGYLVFQTCHAIRASYNYILFEEEIPAYASLTLVFFMLIPPKLRNMRTRMQVFVIFAGAVLYTVLVILANNYLRVLDLLPEYRRIGYSGLQFYMCEFIFLLKRDIVYHIGWGAYRYPLLVVLISALMFARYFLRFSGSEKARRLKRRLRGVLLNWI